MNCLEFRREKLADPRRVPSEAQAHAAGCPACAAFAREVDENEQALEAALMTPVPEGFADRVILRSRAPHARWRVRALAAGLVAAAGGGLLVWKTQTDSSEYARAAIEHVAMEPESLATVRNADADAFRAVVAKLGGSVKDIPGKIRYIRLCPFEDGLGWHVVFETREGLATLFLVPGKKPKVVQTASVNGWNALVHPMERGYYAIVTASSNTTSRFLQMLRECIVWNA